MPTRPRTPCRAPGCPALTDGPWCPAHQREEYRRQDQNRGTVAERGYGARHRRWRLLVLARDPLCVACLAQGRTTAATVADHIVALEDGGTWALENGQGLCASCHGAKSMREMRARRQQGGSPR